MNDKKLRITGPDATPYTLGQPMHVYDGDLLLGTLDPVPLLKSGTELFVEAFTPARAVSEEPRHVGRLIFLEICAFIAEHYPQIQAISFVFSRQVDVLGAGEQQALARAETMARIGAINVKMTPKANALPGHFVVSGIWPYSQHNLAALHGVLEEERALYREVPIGAGLRDKVGVVAAIQRLMGRENASKPTLSKSL
ncbi:hypothetical protein QTI66_00625 [Variovorax sp. J22R133]|uniref:hypothetical protein n=1 Tax=Variovorax brevis TaxID=3053503 RepID=UPI002574B663|nr:hypothetical protein [Variovorax sp. J22R133]MDM0110629.1 hypothetical protein [Variovorax sp. J22R133]